jgi:integrase
MAGLTQPHTYFEVRGNRKEEVSQPKYQAISSHTCRRSFCTNQFKLGMPVLIIRKISGHNTEKAFLQYIRIDEEEAAQEMARRWVAQNATSSIY